jgi:hypothetical protein
MTVDAAQGLQERRKTVEGHEVRVVSYKIGDRFGSRVDNIDPGDVIGRGRGATREEAEDAAVEAASLRLGLTSAREMLQKSVGHLNRGSTPR